LIEGEKAGAKAIRNIMIAEETREMWRQLRSIDPTEDSGVSSIEVPSDGNLDSTHCKNCTSWTTLEQPREIEEALRRRNLQHFGQAHGTPPTVSPLREKIDWAASTYSSEMILEGIEPTDEEISQIERLMLSQFKRTTALDSIKSELTEAEWLGKMKVWNESTSTSPSGMHLGHHKALNKPFPIPEDYDADDPDSLPLCEDLRQELLKGQLQLMNYAIRHSHCYERWSKVANFMIHKEPGNCKIHRLRED
jgi:hypothetical protein